MSIAESQLETLVSRIEARDRRSRRIGIVATVIPAIIGLLIIGLASSQVSGLNGKAKAAEEKLRATEEKLRTTEEKLRSAERELGETRTTLRELASFERYVAHITPADIKHLGALYPEKSHLFFNLFRSMERDTPWKYGGRTESEGFDSPTFAAYVLDVLPEFGPGSTRELLLRRFSSVSQPRPGDLIFYPNGYVMFYAVSERGGELAIGMTPFGVGALKFRFAQPLQYRRTQ